MDISAYRNLLLTIEAKPDYEPIDAGQISCPDVGSTEGHVKILRDMEAGELVELIDQKNRVLVSMITWKGHETLDHIRNDAIWNAARESEIWQEGMAAFLQVAERAKKIALARAD